MLLARASASLPMPSLLTCSLIGDACLRQPACFQPAAVPFIQQTTVIASRALPSPSPRAEPGPASMHPRTDTAAFPDDAVEGADLGFELSPDDVARLPEPQHQPPGPGHRPRVRGHMTELSQVHGLTLPAGRAACAPTRGDALPGLEIKARIRRTR